MKKSKAGFFVMILGIVLILGCENDLTGSHIAEESDSRTAGSEIKPSSTLYKTVETNNFRELRVIPEEANNKLLEVKNGCYYYTYSDADGYSGTIKSYDYSIWTSPYMDDGYLVFNLKVFYKGTVSQSIALNKTVEADNFRELRVIPEEANNKLLEVKNGCYYYTYSDADGYRGTLKSYDYMIWSSPYTENGYLVFNLKVYYKGTVYN